MSNKTRYFVVTAAAILGVGLTTGLVASYMGLPVAFSRAAGPDELQYVPANAAVVAYANVHDVMSSNFRQRFRKFEPDSKARDEFLEKTGVNIEEDIQTVVAAMMPKAEGATTDRNLPVAFSCSLAAASNPPVWKPWPSSTAAQSRNTAASG